MASEQDNGPPRRTHKPHRCGRCGNTGHHAQRCFAVLLFDSRFAVDYADRRPHEQIQPPRLEPKWKPLRPVINRNCGKCGTHGHDSRCCFAVVPDTGPRIPTNQCKYCNGHGHSSWACDLRPKRQCETCAASIGHGARRLCRACWTAANQRAMRACAGCGQQFRPIRHDSAVCGGSVECLRIARSRASAARFDSLLGLRFGMWTVVEHDRALNCVVRCECGYTTVRNPTALKDGNTKSCRYCASRSRAAERTEAELRLREEAFRNAERERSHAPNRSPMFQPGKHWAKERAAKRKALIDGIKKGPCMDCGGRFHPVSMDFDHRPGEIKFGCVSSMAKKAALDEVLAEIAKCDLVCANCHRLRTHTRAIATAIDSHERQLAGLPNKPQTVSKHRRDGLTPVIG